MVQRVRERIPTPENDNRLHVPHNTNNPFSHIQSIATGVALTAQNLATNPSIFQTSNNVPILGTLLLSPIKESDSVNNTVSSNSFAPSKSILPLNYNTTNSTQFGSLVIPSGSSHDLDANTTNSFVVIPTSSTEREIIPVSITTVPLSYSTTHQTASSGAIITELPLDQSDVRSLPTTPNLGSLFDSPILSPAMRHKMQRQQSVESNRSATADNASNVSASTNSTLSKRPGGGNKHSEVYV